MKRLIRGIAINATGLLILTQLFPGLKISGGVQTFIFGGFFLWLMGFFLRPLLNLVALPFNLLTFGVASFFVNAIILYLLTLIVSEISIMPFLFPGFSFAGVIIPKFFLNLFFAYIVSAIVLSFMVSVIQWLIKD